MTADDLRAIMNFLRDAVHLRDGDAVEIEFRVPSVDDMIAVGLDADGSRQVRDAPWWEEMVTDVIETPEMCEEGDTPAQILDYARDVVTEYIRKRAAL